MANVASKTNPSSSQQLRQFLEEKSSELRSHLRMPAVNPILHATEDPYDSGDWSSKSHDEWIFLQTNSVDMELLREIEDAIARLGDGSYGVCADCGIQISQKRLDAIPWAHYCVTCQERRQTGNN